MTTRRERDVEDVLMALDWYIQARFGIEPRVYHYDLQYYDYERQDKARQELAKALIAATGNPEPE